MVCGNLAGSQSPLRGGFPYFSRKERPLTVYAGSIPRSWSHRFRCAYFPAICCEPFIRVFLDFISASYRDLSLAGRVKTTKLLFASYRIAITLFHVSTLSTRARTRYAYYIPCTECVLLVIDRVIDLLTSREIRSYLIWCRSFKLIIYCLIHMVW